MRIHVVTRFFSYQRVELAPQNENLFKIVTFDRFMVQCKSVTV